MYELFDARPYPPSITPPSPKDFISRGTAATGVELEWIIWGFVAIAVAATCIAIYEAIRAWRYSRGR